MRSSCATARIGVGLSLAASISCGSHSGAHDRHGAGSPLRVGAAVVDVTPLSWEKFHDTNGDGLWDFASGETFDDFGSDGIPDRDEPGYDPVTNPDPNGDDYDPVTNPSGTEGNGRFDTVWMAGFDNAHPAQGVHDPITVRALALDQAGLTTALVTLDFVGVLSPSVAPALQRITASTGLDADRVIVASIHNHEGPDTLGLWGKTPYQTGVDPSYLAVVNDAIVQATEEALGSLREARIKVANVDLDLGISDSLLDHRTIDPADPPHLANDTRLPSVRDPELLAIQAVGTDDSTIATLVDWANHPESIGSRNSLLSTDYPGALRERIESKLGGIAVYLSGAVGGLITPLDGALAPYWTEAGERGVDPATGSSWIGDDGFDKARSLGFELAEQAMHGLDAADPETAGYLSFAERESRLPMENLNLVLGVAGGVVAGTEEFFSEDGAGLFDFSDPDHCGHCGCVRTPIVRIDLGGLATIVTAPGEVFPETLDGRPASQASFPTPQFDYGTDRYPAIEGLRNMGGAPENLLLAGLSPNELGYMIPESDYLVFSVADFLFGGVGSPVEHPNFYSEYVSLGPRAGDVLYCDLIDLLQLEPSADTRTACDQVRQSGPVQNGADPVCTVIRALPSPPP